MSKQITNIKNNTCCKKCYGFYGCRNGACECHVQKANHPTDEGMEEIARDLWNWIAINMVDPSHVQSIRNAQKFSSEFCKGIKEALSKARQDERNRIRGVVEEMKKEIPDMTAKERKTITMG